MVLIKTMVQIEPVYASCFKVTFLFDNMMALGGVPVRYNNQNTRIQSNNRINNNITSHAITRLPTGSTSARDTARVTGASMSRGSWPRLGPTQAMAGSNTFATATLDMMLVAHTASNEQMRVIEVRLVVWRPVIALVSKELRPDA